MLWRTYLDSISTQWMDLSTANNITENVAVRAIIQIARGELLPGNLAHNAATLDLLYRLSWWMHVRAPALDPRYLVLTRMNLDLVLERERTLSQVLDELDELETLHARDHELSDSQDQHWLSTLRTMANPEFRVNEADHTTLKAAIDQALALFIENSASLRELSQQVTQELLSNFDSEVRAGMFDVAVSTQEDTGTIEQGIEKLFQHADALYNAADVESAERAYSKVIEHDPNHIGAYTQRGICRAALENLEEARLDFDYVLTELDSSHLTALLNRGLLHHSSGRYLEALKDYDQALTQAPNNVELLLNKGAVLSSIGEYDKALEVFNKAAQLEPENALTYKQRAHLQRQRNAQESALKDYKRSIELNPRDAQVYASRGFLLFLMEHIEEAIADFSQAILLAPGDPTHYYNRANAYSSIGQYENAIEDYTHTIALDSEDGDALINRGSAQMLAGNIVAAAEDWTQAIEIDPYHPTAYLKRATLWIATEQNDEAISDLSLALKYAPKDWPFTLEVERVLEDLTNGVENTQENSVEESNNED